ncbi:hypothetical protein BVX97_06290 [bacterium E08(2017)]|nr:hypothetical protein BVX97_06290 [bacterium E08(2017)]
MKKPTVAILHYTGLPVIGGVEIVIDEHARFFLNAGYDVTLITGKGGNTLSKAKSVVIPEISAKGGPISGTLRSLHQGDVPDSFPRVVKRVEKKLAAALRGVEVCMIHNVMTMHFNLVLTAALANIAKRKKTTRFIAWTHDLTFADPIYEPHQHRRYPWSILLQPVENMDYCVISAQRNRDARKLFRVPASSLPVIPDGINVPRQLRLSPSVAALYEQEKLATCDIIAITPARILRRKNLGVGMEIVASLKKYGNSVRWIITGAPDPHNPESMKYFRLLKKLRVRLKVQKEVVFLCERFDHPVENRDLRSLYRVSDMLLFPSDREGFGLPVLEAGLSNLLTVLSDIPALRELASKEAVFIHLGDSSDEVAKKILAALGNRMQYEYRKHVMAHYSWDIVFKNHVEPAVLHPRKVWEKK